MKCYYSRYSFNNKAQMKRHVAAKPRMLAMLKRRNDGETYKSISSSYGITANRVRSIVEHVKFLLKFYPELFNPGDDQ